MPDRETMTCHECGRSMVRGTRPVEFAYKGKSITLDQPGFYCEGCGEGVHTGADMAATESAFMDVKAGIDGLVSGAEAARIRKKLKLSQRQAGLLLGGGENAFQRYEARKDLPTRAMSNLLRLLDNDPDRLDELRRRAGAAGSGTKARGRRRQEHAA